jgi:hypothetical protein
MPGPPEPLRDLVRDGAYWPPEPVPDRRRPNLLDRERPPEPLTFLTLRPEPVPDRRRPNLLGGTPPLRTGRSRHCRTPEGSRRCRRRGRGPAGHRRVRTPSGAATTRHLSTRIPVPSTRDTESIGSLPETAPAQTGDIGQQCHLQDRHRPARTVPKDQGQLVPATSAAVGIQSVSVRRRSSRPIGA